MRKATVNTGFTLIELVLIIVIIGIVASIAMRSLIPAVDQSRIDATMKEMNTLAEAIAGDRNLVSDGLRSDFGYVGDIGALPPNLDALASNPGGYGTWNGPYILNDFSEDPNGFKEDAWGDPYQYSAGVVIISNGNGSPITKTIASSAGDLVANTVFGNIFDGLGHAPGDSAGDVTVVIFYPDGAGGMTSASTNPSSSGQFSFDGMIPVGNRLVRASYSSASDTTSVYVSVLPGGKAFCELRFSGSYW